MSLILQTPSSETTLENLRLALLGHQREEKRARRRAGLSLKEEMLSVASDVQSGVEYSARQLQKLLNGDQRRSDM